MSGCVCGHNARDHEIQEGSTILFVVCRECDCELTCEPVILVQEKEKA